MEANAQQQVAELNTLLEVSRKLGGATKLTPLLEEIVAAAIGVLDCERATVFLYAPDTHELYSMVATGEETIRFNADKGIAGDTVRSGQIINVADAYADTRFNRDIDKKTGFTTRNLLTCPLHGHQQELVGVLQVLNRRGGPFDTHDEQVATTLGSLAGVAIQRQMLLDAFAEKQKLERDLSLAREIQQSLLPESDPDLANFSIAGYSEPADATGGDCYDYIEMPDGRLGLLIADATGHGIGPALIVSQYRAMIRALTACEHVTMDVMCRVNDLLGHDLPPGMFVTTFFGVLHSRTATVKYLSAGHGPLLLYRRATDEAIELEADTFPLGILSPLECEPPPPIELAPGDVFLLVTDGFFEWPNAQREQFGVGRIFDVIRANPEATASELIHAVRDAVRQFTAGTPQADDLTAIAIKRTS